MWSIKRRFSSSSNLPEIKSVKFNNVIQRQLYYIVLLIQDKTLHCIVYCIVADRRYIVLLIQDKTTHFYYR